MIPMFFPTFSPSPSILSIQYLLFIQHLTGYACALQSLLDTVPSGQRTEKTGAFIKTTQYSLPLPARHQTRNARKRQGTAGNAGNQKYSEGRRKEEETDGLSMESLQKDGGRQTFLPAIKVRRYLLILKCRKKYCSSCPLTLVRRMAVTVFPPSSSPVWMTGTVGL